jgi:hypothetical protein
MYAMRYAYEYAVKHLAAIDSYHPDYQQEWKLP